MTNQQAKLRLTVATVAALVVTWLIVEYVTWTHVGIYLLIAVPLLTLFCRGTDASELNENESK